MKKRDFELIQTLTNMKKAGKKSPIVEPQNNSEAEEREMINVINYADRLPNLDLKSTKTTPCAPAPQKEA